LFVLMVYAVSLASEFIVVNLCANSVIVVFNNS
jgi:hypothetical protein